MKAKDLIKLLEQHPDEEVAFATRMSFPRNVMPITGVALSVGDKFPRSVKLLTRVERDVFIFILCSD